jgi:hypothetical protein
MGIPLEEKNGQTVRYTPAASAPAQKEVATPFFGIISQILRK